MPKKKNKVSKKKTKIKEIKSKKKIISKDSSLEEDIEQEEEAIEETEFKEFLKPEITSTPTLRRILTQESPEIDLDSLPPAETSEIKQTEYVNPSSESNYIDNVTGDSNKETQEKYEMGIDSPVLEQTGLRPQNPESKSISTNILEQKRREPFEIEEKKYIH